MEEADPLLERHLRDLLDWTPYDRSPDIARPGEPTCDLKGADPNNLDLNRVSIAGRQTAW